MGASIYRQLLGQIDDLVRPATRLVIAPDSYLSAVPFGALPGSGNDNPALLMDHKEIEYVPSATVFAWLRANPEAGAPRPAARSILALVPANQGQLAGVKREVDALRARLSSVEVVAGKPELSGLENGSGAREVIHVAAHVVVNDEKPWFSGILLEPETALDDSTSVVTRENRAADLINRDLRRDPFLRAGEIASRRIPAQLAVLAGCESALGRTSNGEGVLGLTSAFLSAGVPSVVSTLWPVDDQVTADLMLAFYEFLAEGETVASALRRAQTAIRSGEATRHPFYWAGFVVVGDGGTGVAVSKSRNLSATTATVFATGILLLVILLRSFLGTRAKKTRPTV
jgi:CHAT domain-containing protein